MNNILRASRGEVRAKRMARRPKRKLCSRGVRKIKVQLTATVLRKSGRAVNSGLSIILQGQGRFKKALKRRRARPYS